nr:hypothetical protein 49p1_00004 [Yersinia frederiksenii]
MNQSDCFGKALKPWPIFVDHYRQPLSTDKPELADKLDESGDVLRLPDGHPQGDLHHQRHRVAEQRDPACH